MPRGRVKWFNEIKGYGFIRCEDGTDVFVHYKNIRGEGFRTLDENEEVLFEICNDLKGLRAVNLMKMEEGTFEESGKGTFD